MFRLIQAQAQAGLRPGLLTKVRPPRTFQQGSFRSLNTNASPSTIPTSTENEKIPVVSIQSNLVSTLSTTDLSAKVRHFNDCYSRARNLEASNTKRGPGKGKVNKAALEAEFEAMYDVVALFIDDIDLRKALDVKQVEIAMLSLRKYVKMRRQSRLWGKLNFDKDSRRESNDDASLMVLTQQVMLIIALGDLNHVLLADSVQNLIAALQELGMEREMFELWESNITIEEMAPVYLSPLVLATVLPLGFHANRFTYEQVWQIYELNKDVKNHKGKIVEPNTKLLSLMGQVAVSAGDYSRGLDMFEDLLHRYENATSTWKKVDVLRSLCTLHLEFIRSSKDLSIAMHFFNKVINKDLPYQPMLKVDCVALMMNTILATGDFEALRDVWLKTTMFYLAETSGHASLRLRYSVLNNAFFKGFFSIYPSLTPESHECLKQVMQTYTDNRELDEMMINNLVSNYSWNDKRVYDQLLMYYDAYNVERTQVLYRVALKKLGDIPEATITDIISGWNLCLNNLDNDGVKYIPVADWAALRDATVAADPATEERTNLYIAVAYAYRNFHQDDQSVRRFVSNWLRQPELFAIVRRLITGEVPQVDKFAGKGKFANLRENVKFDELAIPVLERKLQRDQARVY